MTYAEFLKSQGASDADIQLLDTPIARKGYEAMQASVAAAETVKAAAKKEREDLNKWFNEDATPTFERMRDESIAAKAEAARVKAILEASQNVGLVELARGAGTDPAKIDPARAAAAGAFDEERFLRERILPIAEQEGAAIAMVQNIAWEHNRLFPDKNIDFEVLRQKAKSNRQSIKQAWESEFNVQAARDKVAADRAAAHDEAIRKEEREKVLSDVASRYANPNTSPLSPSRNPFAQRAETGRTKQPWELGGGEDGSALQSDRVRRATEKLMKSQVTN